jgi:hypothetical protein
MRRSQLPVKRALLTAIGAIAFGCVTGSACALNTELLAEGVSTLSYAPKPLTADLSRMRVRFTTTGRARPGYYYDVYLFINPRDDRGCVSLGVSDRTGTDRILGAPDHTYTVSLSGVKRPPGDFCDGRAEVTVVSRSIDPSSKRTRILRAISLRVLRVK